MSKKVADAKAASGNTNKQVEQLQAEVDSHKAWKDKYEHVRTQAASMKDRYEEHISDLEMEKEKIIKDAQEAINRAREGSGPGSGSKDAIVAEVKKIMNSVYHDLKKEFAAEKSYKGSDIHGVILSTVKSTTMKMVQEQEESSGGVEEDMEVAAVASTVSAPAKPASGKKADKPDKGGFSLAGLEASIITGDIIPSDKGKSAKSPDAKKSKTDTETVPVVAMVTGDKGNPYYAEELLKAAEKAKAEQAKIETGTSKSKDKSKEPKVDPVVAPITGDKGNPYYAEELRKAAEAAKAKGATGTPEKATKEEVVQPVMSMTTAAPPPKASKDTVQKPVDVKTTSAAPPAKASDEKKTTEVKAAVCGDKGNPYYAEELRKAAEAAKDKAAKEKPEVAPVTGDKGNPYYAAELMGKTLEKQTPDPPKRSEAEVIAGIESSLLNFSDLVQKSDDTQTKKAKDADNKSQKEKKQEKKDDKKQGKEEKKQEKKEEKKPEKKEDKGKEKSKPAASGDKKSPLFDDDDGDDLFAAKPAKKDTKDQSKADPKKTETKKPAAAKDAKKGSDSEDVKKKK